MSEDGASPEDIDDVDDELVTLVVTEAQAGGRLDAVIASAVAALSRTQVQRLIDDGRVTVSGLPATKAKLRVAAGEPIELRVPPVEALEALPEDIPLSVMYEDAELIAIDKPAGMVVHPAPGHSRGTLVNALLFHCTDLSGIGGVARPGIVHRLDKDTTGVIVATKTDRAHAGLAAAFAAKSAGQGGGIERAYVAICAPAPMRARATLRTLYGRHAVDRKKFSSKVERGKPAVTHYETVEKLAGSALVKFRLETGRTHQIRVHAADHGFPILGDGVYGKKSPVIARQALHAQLLAFDHPVSGERMRFESALPADFEAALAALRGT